MTPTDNLFAQAITHHRGGQLAEAEQLYHQVLAADPHHAGVLTNLGVLAARAGNLAEAERLYAAAVAANPQQLDAHFNLGNLFRKLGRPQAAASAFQTVLRIDPHHPKAHLHLGLVAGDVGDAPAAIELFRRAVSLDPGLSEGHNLLGDTLYRTGRVEDAHRAWQEFVVRCPDDPRAHNNLGLALAALGKSEESATELELALKLRPDYPEAHNMLGVVLESLGRADEAHSHYREAVKLRPEFADPWSNLGANLTEQGRVAEAIAALRTAQELRANPRTGDNLLLALAYSSAIAPEQLRDEHIAWAARFADPLAPEQLHHITNRDPNRRLRIGYVSGDFRTHPAAGLIEQLLTHHDRNAVHVTCYANITRPDETTDRLRRLADGWRMVTTLPDATLAEQVRADEIDVLIDLNGHTAGNRLLAFARKPAAVQLTLFGSPVTTGLKAIDFRLSDAFASPPEADSLATEAILRLPEIGWVYSPPPAAPTPNPLPSASRRAFTFGCLNNPAKLSDACLETWAAVLKAVPKSRLVLMAGRSADAARLLTDRFKQLGVTSDRLELVYRLPANEYLDAYQSLDVCLDPFPFNGMLTTCDALWMGVPMITVTGHDMRSRQGVSILHSLGLPEFIADTPEKLVELAATWSDHRTRLAELRGSLREMMRRSPLTNAAAFVRHLEAAYRSAWQEKVK